MLSLVTIIAIYREGGILKRLRATPLRPHTILTAHVLVKLLFTALTLASWSLAGRRTSLRARRCPLFSLRRGAAVQHVGILSLGFLIASVVPTARFAQPIGALILYPMIASRDCSFPVSALPPRLQAGRARAAAHLRGVAARRHLAGRGWSAHLGDVAALTLFFVAFTAISSRVFRWE